MTKELLPAIPDEIILNKIYLVREQKVMIDRDLARLYGVETKRLKEAVKRNIDRFPEDFMFEMTKEELEIWRSQFATSKSDMMGKHKLLFDVKTIHSANLITKFAVLERRTDFIS